MLWIEHLAIGRFLLVSASSRPTEKEKVVHLLPEEIPRQKKERVWLGRGILKPKGGEP